MNLLPVTSPDPSFDDLLEAHQPRLYGYILSLTGQPATAKDVLQETNLVLWRKAETYQPGTNFTAWAIRVAHFQVLSQRQRQRRDQSRLVFDDALMELMAGESEEEALAQDNRTQALKVRAEALQDCLLKLPPRQRDLVRRRYLDGQSVAVLSEALGEPANRIS
ncbi:MAG TPA: sigma-70 family RNA polymerase sigma factor, partial [Verrucomicrobiales bacterium]|nr:sigma-70 family RNA polymerase sigma factor [Verrucomicrobiales bacterium]